MSCKPAQSLLTQCLSAYNSNQERLATMERHLEQYGYSQQYSMPAPQDPFSQLPQPAPAGLTPNSAQQVSVLVCWPAACDSLNTTGLLTQRVLVLLGVLHRDAVNLTP